VHQNQIISGNVLLLQMMMMVMVGAYRMTDWLSV
jgi:hypothetical protein